MAIVKFKNNTVIHSYEAKKGDLFVDMQGNLCLCGGFNAGDRMECTIVGGYRSGHVLTKAGEEPVIPVKNIEVEVKTGDSK